MPAKLPEPEAILTLRELNRAALARQMLLKREEVGVVEAIERLAGMQAQYSPSPYIGLWTRLKGFQIEELVTAILDKMVVKASLMRWTLHLASSRDYPYFTVAVGDALVAMSRKEADEAGQHIPTLHKALLEYATEPRLFAQLVDFANGVAGDPPRRHMHLAWRWAHAPGWLVHVPPSGIWRYFGSNSYMSAHEWLGSMQEPMVEEAITYLVRRYLAAYGPSTVADIVQWAGLRSVGRATSALADLADEIVVFRNEDGKLLYDLRDAPRPGADVPAPIRYLPK
ncbi:MAG: winged helix DNA-binding domain-containing protein, partial [Chloroflexia bacterium]